MKIKWIGLACLIFLTLNKMAFAQKKKVKFDSLQNSSFGFGYDVSRLYMTALHPQDRRLEIMTDWNHNKHFIVAEYGEATDVKDGPGYNYLSNGYYFRLGYEKNFLINTDDIYFFGGRYAFSNYHFNAYNVVLQGDPANDNLYGKSSYVIANQKVNAQWVEMVTGLKVKMFSVFYLGFTARVKLNVTMTSGLPFTPFYTPGYGVADNAGNLGFNYYIQFRFPYRKKVLKQLAQD